MARAIISELACTPVHIPGQLLSVFGKSLCTEAALSVYSSPLLVVWNEENKTAQTGEIWKNPGDSTSFGIDEKPFIRRFQQESVCRNVSPSWIRFRGSLPIHFVCCESEIALCSSGLGG